VESKFNGKAVGQRTVERYVASNMLLDAIRDAVKWDSDIRTAQAANIAKAIAHWARIAGMVEGPQPVGLFDMLAADGYTIFQ
jgi:hypothetical protein